MKLTMYVVIAMYYHNESEERDPEQVILGVTRSKKKANDRVIRWYEENLKLVTDCNSSEKLTLIDEEQGFLAADCINEFGEYKAYVYIESTTLL